MKFKTDKFEDLSKEEIRDRLENGFANLAIEGLEPTAEEKAFIYSMIEEGLSEDEMVEHIMDSVLNESPTIAE